MMGIGMVSVTLALPPAVSVTLGALRESWKLVARAFSETLPENPLRLFTVIFVVDVLPCGMLSDDGDAVMLKSGTVLTLTTRICERTRTPDVAVITTMYEPGIAPVIVRLAAAYPVGLGVTVVAFR